MPSDDDVLAMLAQRRRDEEINAIMDEFNNHAGSMAVAIYNLRRAASGE